MWGARPVAEDFYQVFKTNKKGCFSYFSEMHKDFILQILQSGMLSIFQEIWIQALHMLLCTSPFDQLNSEAN